MLLWKGLGSWRAEVSAVDLDGDRLSASGTQLGVDPLPYRLDYNLTTGPRWVTERLDVVATGQGWRRHLELRHDVSGAWTCSVEREGEVDLPDTASDLAHGTALVRYVGAHRGFVGDLTVDAAGCVLTYPDLAQRVSP